MLAVNMLLKTVKVYQIKLSIVAYVGGLLEADSMQLKEPCDVKTKRAYL